MRVIIDTNRLQSEELWAFLAMSPDNRAVLPDYVLMEIMKPGRPEGVQGAFSILGQFPSQILALKGTDTYFDGVMSADALSNETFVFAFEVLKATRVKTGANYLADYFPQVVAFGQAQPGPGPLGGAQVT